MLSRTGHHEPCEWAAHISSHFNPKRARCLRSPSASLPLALVRRETERSLRLAVLSPVEQFDLLDPVMPEFSRVGAPML